MIPEFGYFCDEKFIESSEIRPKAASCVVIGSQGSKADHHVYKSVSIVKCVCKWSFFCLSVLHHSQFYSRLIPVIYG